MAVRKIKNSWWVDFRFGGSRFRKRSPENTRAGALVYEATLRQKLIKGESIDSLEDENKQAREQLFKRFAWNWFDVYIKNKKKYSSVKSYEQILKVHLIPHFGNTPIKKITNLQIEQYKSKKIDKGLANKTINNQLIVLSKSLHCAKEWYGLEKIPRVGWLKNPPAPDVFLTEKECDELLKYAEGVWYEMILVALKTGLRLGELIGLKWEDIDFKNEILTVNRAIVRNIEGPPKSNRTRHIPLTSDVWLMLRKRKKDTGFVFMTREGFCLSTNNCYLNLRRICKKANLKKIGWHVLRHTFASRLVGLNAPIKAVQELLGHKDIKTTMRYAHLAPSTLNSAISLLDPAEKNIGQPAVNRRNIYDLNDSGTMIILPNIKQKQAPKGTVNV